MRFDYCCGAVHLGRFHNIRINGTLSEPFYISELMCFLLKYFHKVPAYDSAFCLRIGDSCKVGQEFIRSICNRHIQSHIAVGIHNIANLVLAQQSRVHEYAVQAFAYCLVQQNCSHGRVHPAGKSEHHFVFAQLTAQVRHATLDEGFSCPFSLAAANVQHEVGEDMGSLSAVDHLRMELQSPGRLPGKSVGRHGHILCGCNDFQTFGKAGNGVSVGHPDL